MKKAKPFLSNQTGSSRTDTVLKMLLIAFIALLAFSSGVYFGKQLSDSDYQLKALESDFNNTHGGKLAEGSHEGGPEEALNREEAASLSESLAEKLVKGEKAEIAQKDAHADGHASANSDSHAQEARKVASSAEGHHEPQAAEHASAPSAAAHAQTAPAASKAHDNAHAAPEHAAPASSHGQEQAHAAPASHPHAQALPQKPDLSAATKAAMRVANNAAPADAPKAEGTARVPTSLPKTVGLSQDVEFTVQVASYPTEDIAKERADELVKKGFPAFPVEATVNGKVWYRVSVGSFKTQREATAYRAQLLKQANLTSAIVQKITR